MIKTERAVDFFITTQTISSKDHILMLCKMMEAVSKCEEKLSASNVA